MENNFCGLCGSKLVEHLRQRFNTETGEQLKGKHCPNLKCEEGCSFEGHKFTFFSQNECKRCGFCYPDY